MCNNETVNFNNRLYIIYRKVKTDQVKEMYIQDIKKFWLCDLVVKNNNQNGQYFYFLREIPEVELVN